MLTAKQITCQRQQKLIFADLCFSVTPGECLVITGDNGCGKSSLLKMLAGLLQPISGTITWQKKGIVSNRNYVQNLHFISHQSGIKTALTVEENLKLSQKLMPHLNQTCQLELALEYYHLKQIRSQFASQLSAGQQRRLALARLKLISKKIWILDEPLTALDQDTQSLFIEHLNTHTSLGGMAIISSHHPIDLRTTTLINLRLEKEC